DRRVTDLMTGLLPSAEQAKLLARIEGKGDGITNAHVTPEYRLVELAILLNAGWHTVLDVRDRTAYQKQHEAGSVNIPLDELEVRAPHELRDKVLLDCSRTSINDCRAADIKLQRLVPAVAILTQ